MLDTALVCGDLTGMVREVAVRIEDDWVRQVWLHKVFDKSLDDFKRGLRVKRLANRPVSARRVASSINDSKAILSGFRLEGGVTDAAIQPAG